MLFPGIFNFTVGILVQVWSKIRTTTQTKESWTENLDLVPNTAHDRQSGPLRRLVRVTDFGFFGIFGPRTDRIFQGPDQSGRAVGPFMLPGMVDNWEDRKTVHYTYDLFCRFFRF